MGVVEGLWRGSVGGVVGERWVKVVERLWDW